MNTTLQTNFIYAYIDEELDIQFIGFADDEFETQDYILLQKLLHPAKEDVTDGMDAVHITYKDEAQSLYGGIVKLVLSEKGVELTVTDEAAQRLQTTSIIIISFHQPDLELATLNNHLAQMFSEQEGVYRYETGSI